MRTWPGILRYVIKRYSYTERSKSSRWIVFAVIACVVCCDVTALIRTKRLMDGRLAEKNEFPHQVSVQHCELPRRNMPEQVGTSILPNGCYKLGRHLCSGFILNEDSIVTAGKCSLYEKVFAGPMYAVLGITSLKQTNGSYHKVVEIKVSPEKKYSLDYSVALFKVVPRIEWSRSIQPAPAINLNRYRHKTCKVSGYGCNRRIRSPELTCNLTKELHATEIPTSTTISCEKLVRKRSYRADPLDFICFRVHTVCNGDLGNPLTCGNGVVAVATTKFDSCETDTSDLYIDLRKHYEFLNDPNKCSSPASQLCSIFFFPFYLMFTSF